MCFARVHARQYRFRSQIQTRNILSANIPPCRFHRSFNAVNRTRRRFVNSPLRKNKKFSSIASSYRVSPRPGRITITLSLLGRNITNRWYYFLFVFHTKDSNFYPIVIRHVDVLEIQHGECSRETPQEKITAKLPRCESFRDTSARNRPEIFIDDSQRENIFESVFRSKITGSVRSTPFFIHEWTKYISLPVVSCNACESTTVAHTVLKI